MKALSTRERRAPTALRPRLGIAADQLGEQERDRDGYGHDGREHGDGTLSVTDDRHLRRFPRQASRECDRHPCRHDGPGEHEREEGQGETHRPPAENRRRIYVEREHVEGVTKPYGKTAASRRRVPLTAAALEALEELPAPLDSALQFPAVRGGYLKLRNWRSLEWDPAVESAGLAVCNCGHLSGSHDLGREARGCRCEGVRAVDLSPVPYVLRHTFASNALAAQPASGRWSSRGDGNLARDDRADVWASRTRC